MRKFVITGRGALLKFLSSGKPMEFTFRILPSTDLGKHSGQTSLCGSLPKKGDFTEVRSLLELILGTLVSSGDVVGEETSLVERMQQDGGLCLRGILAGGSAAPGCTRSLHVP